MGCDCGTCIAKYVLCIFNFIFFLGGSIVLGVGIWLAADKASFIALLKMVESEHLQQFTQPAVIEQMAYILIVCGAVMFFLSFLGYCGAIRESQCLLTTYAVFMIILLLLEITAGTLAAVYKEKARDETKQFLNSTIQKYYSSAEQTDAVTLMWNHLMAQMSCCGINDYKDFETSQNWMDHKNGRQVPEACCILADKSLLLPQDTNCPRSPDSSNSYYQNGCFDAFIDWINLNRTIVLSVVITIGIIQLFAIFLAFCLCKAIDKYKGMRL